MAAEQEQSPNLLDFNNKQENNGTNNRGRLTAHEFNQLINAVNNNSNDTFSFKKQVGNLSFDVIENINPTGPFINIVLNKALISDHIIKDVFEKKEEYGTSTIGCGQTVVLDYSSPNIAKSFSVGHLRSTMIGNSLKLILNRCGYKTVSINYLGDWGTQFGKMIVAIEKWGNLDEIKKDPINQL